MNRNKEDVKHERIIRGLAKLDDNRKCLNCGSLAPQYVCVNFSTFVCMACSGVHREFNHRVKSISIARFSPEEVAALQAGGNKRALERYFKHWDSRHLPLPESSNPDKLRDFIKAIYVDQRYSANKPPPFPKEEEYDGRRNSLRANFLSSHSFEERRPSQQKETHQRTRSEDRPSHNDLGDRYSPPVRSMREILGEDMPSLRIEPARSSAAPETRDQAFPESFGSVPANASTTGWATFDTAPSVSSATGGWEDFKQTSANAHSYVMPAPAFYPALVPTVNPHDLPATTSHRKSINPFDLPEEDVSPSPMNSNFAFQHLQVTSSGEFLPPTSEQAWFPVSFSPTTDFSTTDIGQTSRPGNPFC